MSSTNFLREKTWINLVPKRAPIPAPIGMHPVRIPFAVSAPIVIANIVMIYLNSTVLMYTNEYPK